MLHPRLKTIVGRNNLVLCDRSSIGGETQRGNLVACEIFTRSAETSSRLLSPSRTVKAQDDLLTACMNRRNDDWQLNLFKCVYAHQPIASLKHIMI